MSMMTKYASGRKIFVFVTVIVKKTRQIVQTRTYCHQKRPSSLSSIVANYGDYPVGFNFRIRKPDRW